MTFNEALPYILAGLAILLLFVAFFYLANRKTTVVSADRRDVLDEGAERAKRNNALIDAPRSVEMSTGATSAAANSDTIAAASADADAEAGVGVAPTVGDPVPEPAPAPAPAPAKTDAADDLTTIKGLGPKLATLLNEQGITSFGQIAAWDDSDVARIDAMLGRFKGRITRDNWVEQAKLLAAGDKSGFAAKFGQNG